MSTLNKSSIEVLNNVGLCQEKNVGLCQEKEEALFQKSCSHCYSEKVKIHSYY